MKKILFLFITIHTCFFYGQAPQGEKPKPIKFVASDRCGILYYEAQEVAENIKVKDDTDQFYDMAKALRKYNGKVKEVAFLNSKKFKELDVLINKALHKKEDQIADLDAEAAKKKQQETKELIKVIPETRKKILEFEIELTKKLKEILKEKQFKKWLKYHKKKQRSLHPERPSTNNNGPGKMSRSGFGQGPNFGNRGVGSRGLY